MEDLTKLTYTLDEAAEAMNVSRATMSKIIHRRDFPAFRAGRRWIIPIDAFKKWLSEQTEIPTNDVCA